MIRQRPGGSITIAGRSVSRLGLGTMRLLGPGTWGGAHPDPHTARQVLREAVDVYGISHIDTADAYGPHTAEVLVREALRPYPAHVLIATKVGLIRPDASTWTPLGRPEYLKSAVEMSLRRLGAERIDLCYLHRVDPAVPLVDQVGALLDLMGQGKVGAIGLSKVTCSQINEARVLTPIAAVQNCLNLGEPDDPALAYCAEHAIPYVAFRPLSLGALEPKEALAFLFEKDPTIAAIPGTGNPAHLRDLVDAAWTCTPGGAACGSDIASGGSSDPASSKTPTAAGRFAAHNHQWPVLFRTLTPMDQSIWALVDQLRAWFDTTEDATAHTTLAFRILKLTEETGEAAQALVDAAGQNPRKPKTDDMDHVVKELCDVVLTALLALSTITPDVSSIFADHVRNAARRAAEAGAPITAPPAATPA